MKPKKVLFLCTGNSCRSQIAEAITNARLSDAWQAFSAGTDPTGYVHPKAIEVLQEIGILHQGTSKSVENMQDIPFDLVVTVCDSAAEECPLWLGPGRRVHHSFPDPAKATGTEEQITAAFRQVRDKIAFEIPILLGKYTP
ncbi:MAG: arsC [Chloroflexi bacterium]|jgi:arsenate reductase|nr:arsC [Chloroflexota bacterium]